MPLSSSDHIEITEAYSAHNYAPLPIVISEAKGSWVTDVEGKKYLDMLSAYSALNWGHGHPRMVAAAEKQLRTLPLTSRAFYNDQLGLLCKELAELSGMESVLLMNSGAEAVETALKLARRWGYREKSIPEGQAEIIAFANNFHGRTTTICSFTTTPEYQKDFGPFTPGFVVVPFGDVQALAQAFTPRTVGVLIEPIQGEGGVIIPPAGFIKKVRELCSVNSALMIADEIQTGLCRTGALFCCDHESVIPDCYLVAKSLGGGILPISAVISKKSLMNLFEPGSHGSTFGGNPLACAVAREVVAFIKDEQPHKRAAELGDWFAAELKKIKGKIVGEVRSKGLMIGVDINPAAGKGKDFCKKLMQVGVLCKDTRQQTLRFAPPLIISKEDLQWGLDKIRSVLG